MNERLWRFGGAGALLLPAGALAAEPAAAPWEPLAWALALLVGAAALLILEFFVVSFGILLLAALGAVGGALFFAFEAGSAIGWGFVIVVPVCAYFIARWGIARVSHSRLVPSEAVDGEAGYHHLADRLQVRPGVEGEMVTAARPTGRARFPGGECDVQVEGGALERGACIEVERIEGPVVYVRPVEVDTTAPSSEAAENDKA